MRVVWEWEHLRLGEEEAGKTWVFKIRLLFMLAKLGWFNCIWDGKMHHYLKEMFCICSVFGYDWCCCVIPSVTPGVVPGRLVDCCWKITKKNKKKNLKIFEKQSCWPTSDRKKTVSCSKCHWSSNWWVSTRCIVVVAVFGNFCVLRSGCMTVLLLFLCCGFMCRVGPAIWTLPSDFDSCLLIVSRNPS